MYVIDGIAYAGEQVSAIKISGVHPMENFKLWVRFNSGEAKIFDFRPLLHTPAFAPLSEGENFRTVYVDYGVPVWMDGSIDISPEYLYENSVAVSQSEENA